MAFAAETMITVPSGAVQISELRVADLILGTGRDPAWEQYEVKVAEANAGPSTALYLQLESGKSITVTADQLFLVFTGTLRQAQTLKPGDVVFGGGRQPIRVLAALIGTYDGETCDVATSAAGDFDGHLIEANGVIVADYELQLRYGA